MEWTGDEQLPSASVDAEGWDLVNPNKKRKKNSEHKKKRPANSFGQFLKHKRATEAKVDFKKARGEWGEMSDNNKEYYKNLFEEEKSKLCGQNSKSLSDGEKESDSGKNSKRGPKVKEPTVVNNSSLSLALQLETLDREMDNINNDADHLLETLIEEKVQLSISQYKMREKKAECDNMKEKYFSLLSQHNMCPQND